MDLITSKVRPTNTSKSEGNKYERQTAKRLSTWMFNDQDVLYKHENSGGRKNVYVGDVIPKKIEDFPWKTYPFVIECKHGYEGHVPTLATQTKLREWLIKLLSERTQHQYIPILIAQFHAQPPIFITDMVLDAFCGIQLAQPWKDGYHMFYVYLFNSLLKLDFYDIIPNGIITFRNEIQPPKVQPVIQKSPRLSPIQRGTYAGIENVIDDILGV